MDLLFLTVFTMVKYQKENLLNNQYRTIDANEFYALIEKLFNLLLLLSSKNDFIINDDKNFLADSKYSVINLTYIMVPTKSKWKKGWLRHFNRYIKPIFNQNKQMNNVNMFIVYDKIIEIYRSNKYDNYHIDTGLPHNIRYQLKYHPSVEKLYDLFL